MERLRVPELLRYLATGLIAIAVVYVCEPEKTSLMLSKLATLGVTFLAFVAGALAYHLYRGMIHVLLLYPIKDVLARRRGNLRTYLRRQYPSMSRSQAELLWYVLRDNQCETRRQSMRAEASGIHLLYLASLSCSAGGVYSLALANWESAALLLGLAPVFGLSALVLDLQFEKLEELALRSMGDEVVRESAKRMGFVDTEASVEGGGTRTEDHPDKAFQTGGSATAER